MKESVRTVELTGEQWQQVLGMIEQGTQVVLSQLAMQPGSLAQVAELSSIANKVTVEIKNQLGDKPAKPSARVLRGKSVKDK